MQSLFLESRLLRTRFLGVRFELAPLLLYCASGSTHRENLDMTHPFPPLSMGAKTGRVESFGGGPGRPIDVSTIDQACNDYVQECGPSSGCGCSSKQIVRRPLPVLKCMTLCAYFSPRQSLYAARRAPQFYHRSAAPWGPLSGRTQSPPRLFSCKSFWKQTDFCAEIPPNP